MSTTKWRVRTKLRASSLLAATVMLVGVATACQPPPPVPVLTVTVPVAGGDTNPGDGICEATLSGTQCTLQAAIQEANALGRANIVMPGGDYAAIDGHITGTVAMSIAPSYSGDMVYLDGVDLTIDEAATLVMTNISIGDKGPEASQHFEVHGNLMADRFHAGSYSPSLFTVSSTGRMLLQNADLITTQAAVVNDGWVELRYSSIWSYAPGVITGAGGVTRMGGVALMTHELHPDATNCGGTAPTSLGYNFATDMTCGLGQTGDVQGLSWATVFNYNSGAARVDKIPLNAIGCGTSTVVDMYGWTRPADGNADGIAACDIGPYEQ
ncbi:MAG: hypothetical protein ABIP03_12225 [Aquihabitans sp.]